MRVRSVVTVVLLGFAASACASDVDEGASPGAARVGPSASPSPAPGGQVVSTTPRLAVPSFIRIDHGVAPKRSWPSAAAAARAHIADFASHYRIERADAERLELRDVHDTGRGAVIARLRRRIDGVEVFGEQIAVAMDRDLAASAITGYVTKSQLDVGAQGGAAALDPVAALIAAIQQLSGVELEHADFAPTSAAADPYQAFAVREAAATRASVGSSQLPRAKPVLFPVSPERAVPAHYVEVTLTPGARGEARGHSFVIGAAGEILWQKSRVAFDGEYSYRVYADADGLHMPWDGPQGTAASPHPTGTLDGYQAPFVPAQRVTLSSLTSIGVNDPWLPPGATTTLGNNVDAYVDIAAPNGFTPGADFRAAVTAPGVFDHVFSPELDAAASQAQRQAGVTQLFYTINWLHDWYYAAGFTEAAGNAQLSNYGRGGLEGDGMRAEAQDSAFWNNASMDTPADGARPTMEVYAWNFGNPSVTIESPPELSAEFSGGAASFSPNQFEVGGRVVRADPPEACQSLDGDYAGAIVLIDLAAGCDPLFQVEMAQAAGAAGVILAKVPSSDRVELPPEPFSVSATSLALPVVGLNLADGERLRQLASRDQALQVTLERDSLRRAAEVDAHVVAHEWGHYISNRLIGDATGLDTRMAGGLGEGWADFHALLLTARAEDTENPSNPSWNGVYTLASYAFGSGSDDPHYYGLRRYPYSTDMRKNPLTFAHISDERALPDDVPRAFDLPHAEPHQVGQVWATMLWECYTALLRDTLGPVARLSFDEARERMRDYLVAAYKLTPRSPTLLEARDALLTAALLNDPADQALFAGAFAKRGAGVFAVAPDRFDDDNRGVVESYAVGGAVVVTGAALSDDVSPVCSADGSLDEGETGNLRLTLQNLGTRASDAIAALVSTTTAGVSFPAGATIAVPPLPVQGVTEVSVPVTASGLVDMTTFAFSVQVGDAGAGAPAAERFEFLGNRDRLPHQSFSDGAESTETLWRTDISGVQPSDGAIWRRVELGPDEHVYRCGSAFSAATVDLVSPTLLVTPGQPLSVSFRHRHSFEYSGRRAYDGGVIEVSRDSGITWADVGGAAYSGRIVPDTGNPLAGSAAFVGNSARYPELVPVTLQLDPGTAATVILRFRVASDDYFESAGWDIDDISFRGAVNAPFEAIVAQRADCNNAPLALLGRTQYLPDVAEGAAVATTVTLDGSASFDADGDALTYHWLQIDGPAVTLSGADGALPTFIAPDVSPDDYAVSYGFMLLVDDGQLRSAEATTYVTVYDSGYGALAAEALSDGGAQR